MDELYAEGGARWSRRDDRLLHRAPTPASTRHEASIAAELSGPGVLPFLGLERGPDGPVVAYSDLGGTLLEHVAQPGLQATLQIALALTRAIGEIHGRGLVHGQFHPANVFLSPDRQRAFIAGFDQASRLNEQTGELQAPERLPFRLPWVSPEQTGRMNRSVGYRADYYALGVTLFRLLSGRLPFRASDPMGWVHAHIAQAPPLAHEVDDSVPAAVAAVVDKLLAKNAEARYQSTRGILADLQRCIDGLEAGTLSPFALGEHDHSERFTLPARLYGREGETRALMSSFERAADEGPAGIVLVSGWSGIGKSALLYEVHRPLAERLGTFLAGKSEPHTRTVPYHSLLQALAAQCARLLTWSEDRVGRIRRRIQASVAPNGQVLVDVLPELALVLGSQPPVTELPTVESQNRFNHTLLRFVQAMAGPDHPVLLFLDDLQWIDGASLDFITQLLQSPDTRNLLILGAYRSNEVDSKHPLALAMPQWEEAGVPVERIELGPLPRGALQAWLRDVTGADGDHLAGFTDLVLDKTGANPFFVRAFLEELHTLELLTYDRELGRWIWDIDELRGRGFTDNVVQHMAKRIDRLPERGRQALSVAAALGARFDLGELIGALDAPAPSLVAAVWEAAEMGLIVPRGAARGMQASLEAVTAGDPAPFAFVHDRVQEAAYGVIAGEDRAAVHLDLARRLRERGHDGRLFELVSHYQRASSLLVDDDERLLVAALLHEAAGLATVAGAHDAALGYLELGVELVGGERWDSHYTLSLGLHTELARADYLRGEVDRAEANAELVLAHAVSELDKLPIYEARVLLASAQMKLIEAVDWTIDLAGRFGVEVPMLLTPEQVGGAMGSIAAAMGERTFLDLADLPVLADPAGRKLLNLLAAATPAAAMAKPEAYAGLLCAAFEYMLEHGITPDSATVVSSYGLFLQMGGLADAAYQTGLAAAAVRKRFGAGAGGFVEFGVFVKGWRDPLRECHALLADGAHRCLEAGHQTNWGYCVNQALKFAVLSGAPLADADADYARDWAALTQRKQINARGSLELWGQVIANLRGEAPDPSRLVGERFDVEALLPFLVEARIGPLLQYATTAQCMLAYLFGDPEFALERGWAHDELAGGGANSVAQPEVDRRCFRSLAALALPDPDMDRVRADRALLAGWAERAPINFAHRLALLDAEIARVEGRDLDAMVEYDRAAELALEHPFPQHHALANELAAAFHIAGGRTGVGRVYLDRAIDAWGRWGAAGKVRELRERYGLAEAAADAGSILDVATVLKFAEAITSEIVLSNLLVRLLALVVENAGATRGALILRVRGELRLMALQDGPSAEAEVFERGQQLGEQQALPTEIVRYAARTRQTVLLADARRDPVYGDAARVRQDGLRSVLCVPLMRQNELSGLLYLDNKLAADAFTPERVALLQALSGQVVIATENASLYSDLDEQAKSFARFVPHQFLSNLGRESIRDVRLGDAVSREMGVLFSDIRGFTSMSEAMSPEQSFSFLNDYLQAIGPVIRAHAGFVDKFIGDAVMALFPGSPEDILTAAVEMQRAVRIFNASHRHPVEIGVGVHRGQLMLGVLGEEVRMDSTVISDAVNVGARLENLCKRYSVGILASQEALDACPDSSLFPHRCLGNEVVRGRAHPVRIYEVFGADDDGLIEAKLATRETFEEAVTLLADPQGGADAFVLLRMLQKKLPNDAVTQVLLQRAAQSVTFSA